MAILPEGYDQLVIARTANEQVEQAVQDLAGLLNRQYGKAPTIRRERLFEYNKRIRIGTNPDHPGFDEDPLTDEILIMRDARGIHIAGSDNTATCFAVYRFLEYFLGWRYYQPGPLGLERLDVIHAGADCVAVISAVVSARDISEACRKLTQTILTARN